jgi:hypothetical protein
MKIKEFVKVKDQIIFNGTYMEVLVPKSYFTDLEIAYFTGHKVEILGIFPFYIFTNPEDAKPSQQHVMRCPVMIVTCPSSTEDVEHNVDELEESSFIKLKYYKGDIFIDNVNVMRLADNVKLFFNLLVSGKMPKLIPYDQILKVLIDCLVINNTNLKTSGTVYEMIISEICRDQKSVRDSFRYRAGKSDKVNMYEYTPMNIKSVARFASTFGAVTFEDIDYSLTTAVNKARQKQVEKESPVEKTIKY